MDQRAWTEQVEAALDSGDHSFLDILSGLGPAVDTPALGLLHCRIRAALGDNEGAAAAFPALADVETEPDLHRGWAAASVELALAGVTPNHWGLGRALTQLAEQAMERDDPAVALEIIERHVRAALGRNAHSVALRGIDLARTIVEPDLQGGRKRRRSAEAAIEALEQQVAAHQGVRPDLPDSAAALLAQLGQDPEQDLEALVAGLEQWPGHVGLLHSAARCWQVLDDEAASIDLFALAMLARPDDVDLATAFGWHLVRLAELPTLLALVNQRFLSDPDPDVQARGHWLLAKGRLDRGTLGSAHASAQRMLALTPDSLPGRHLFAQILRAEGLEEQALDLLDTLASFDGNHHWDRMELGTLLGRWSSVRDSAERLEMPVQPGNDPIDERWSPCRVRLAWVDDADRPAIRTGPVTARITGLEAPGLRQRYGDVILFRAQPIEGPEGDSGPLFLGLKILSRGGYKVQELRGQDPGEQTLRAFGQRLDALGVPLQWWALEQAEADGATLVVRAGLPETVDAGAVETVMGELGTALAGGA